MTSVQRLALAAIVTASLGNVAQAQDLYDPATLRTINITFTQPNWEALLRANYASETNLEGSITVDGVTYPQCGIRIRGNTSYTALPAGSQKFSIKVELDWINPDQEIMTYDTLNLNNSFRDPTFCREVVYNNFVAQFIPNPRANHVLVTINGANWGVYANVQQPDKRMLRDYFTNADGVRFRCPNNPNGPGLRYNGATQSGYTGYEMQEPGGFADPWAKLIEVCNSLTNEPLATWQNMDQKFAIDPSIWSVVMENMLTDDDSYVNKGADFMIYRDPLDGRTHLLQRDANETFTLNWAPTFNFTATTKPFLSRTINGVPENRARYFSHYRHAKQYLNWAYFEPLFTAQRNLIDAHVQADPKKIYTYANFTQNFTSNVTLSAGGLAGGNIVGLQPFFTNRNNTLNAVSELNTPGPTITNVNATSSTPAVSELVYIRANVAANGSPVSRVDLFYRPTPSTGYSRVQMLDNGLNNDGAANDGVFGVRLPINATPGQQVLYYVAATATNAFNSVEFSPPLAERGPLAINYSLSDAPGIRITEWMYSGLSGEFVEFTNMSTVPVNMTGWSFDDDHALPGAFPLAGLGTLAPGESAVITESTAEAFRTAWNLPPSVKVLGGLGISVVGSNSLGRTDILNVYNASNELVDRLAYGDQTLGGPRTQNFSGQPPLAALGQNTVTAWVRAAAGDIYGSYAATSNDIGNPGAYAFAPSLCDSIDFNNNAVFPEDQDVIDFFNVLAGGDCASCNDIDFNNNGVFPEDQDVIDFFNVLAGGDC
ncbi:MAG TPA: CotH kinase family protein [Phycisphaerales bacterium]|nr:CotH kinase family protein [Phycisphaerales bacterium]